MSFLHGQSVNLVDVAAPTTEALHNLQVAIQQFCQLSGTPFNPVYFVTPQGQGSPLPMDSTALFAIIHDLRKYRELVDRIHLHREDPENHEDPIPGFVRSAGILDPENLRTPPEQYAEMLMRIPVGGQGILGGEIMYRPSVFAWKLGPAGSEHRLQDMAEILHKHLEVRQKLSL